MKLLIKQYKFTDSLQYKALENLRLRRKELVKNDNAAKLFGPTLLTIVKKRVVRFRIN